MAENKKTLSEEINMKGELVTSTGGGEPIEKGKRMTTEKRDPDQPRDREGHFEYNASIGKPRKYDYHGVGSKGGIAKTPATMEKLGKLPSFIRKGDKITVGGTTWVNKAGDMTRQEFEDILKEWIGDGYALRDAKGTHRLDDAFERAKGRPTRASKEAEESEEGGEGERTGHIDPKKASGSTQKSMREAMRKYGKAARDSKGNLKNMYHSKKKASASVGGSGQPAKKKPTGVENDTADLSADFNSMSREDFAKKYSGKLDAVASWAESKNLGYEADEVKEAVLDMFEAGDVKSMKDVIDLFE